MGLGNTWRRYSVTCVVCGLTAEKSNKQVTCGIRCREKLRRAQRLAAAVVAPCSVCGTEGTLLFKAGPVYVCHPRCRTVLWQRAQSAPRIREKYVKSPLLGSTKNCEYCAKPFTLKRRNARFCSDKCQDGWHLKHGIKGQNLRAKRSMQRAAFNQTVGHCALCLTPHDVLLPPSALGMMRRNKSAIFHADHVSPKAKGGSDGAANRRYLCWFCNSARMDMSTQYDEAIAAAGQAFWKAVASLA